MQSAVVKTGALLRRAVPVFSVYLLLTLWLYARTGSVTLSMVVGALLGLCVYGAWALFKARYPAVLITKRRKARQARHYLMTLPEAEAQALLFPSVERWLGLTDCAQEDGFMMATYEKQRAAVKLVQCHESQTTGANDIYAFHRRIHPTGADIGILLLLSQASGGAHTVAGRLSSPGVLLIGFDALVPCLAKIQVPENSLAKPLRTPALEGHAPASRCFWGGFALLCLYLWAGFLWYLPAGLLLSLFGCILRYRSNAKPAVPLK